MTLVMAFVITGAFAQVAGTDYSEYDGSAAAPADVDYVTVGSTMGYYAEPDPIYHPDYNAGGSWTLDGDGSWTWTIPTNPGSATLAYPGDANYVQITWVGLGDHVVNVAESYSGGCTDATPQVMNTTVLPEPTAAISGAADDASWTTVTANYEYQRCSSLGAGEDLTVTFTETGVPAALAQYAYAIQMVVTGYDADGGIVEGPTTTTPINYPTSGKANGGSADGGSLTESSPSLDFVQHDFGAGLENVRTKYEFSLVGASDAPADGLISQISHKSDYITIDGGGSESTYAFDAVNPTVTYWINLPPVTGPIYHIPNNFAY